MRHGILWLNYTIPIGRCLYPDWNPILPHSCSVIRNYTSHNYLTYNFNCAYHLLTLIKLYTCSTTEDLINVCAVHTECTQHIPFRSKHGQHFCWFIFQIIPVIIVSIRALHQKALCVFIQKQLQSVHIGWSVPVCHDKLHWPVNIVFSIVTFSAVNNQTIFKF